MRANFLSLKAGAYFLLLLLWWVGTAAATDNYVYRAGEYVTVSGGRSPDGRWSIAAHGGGEYGSDGFDLYLMQEPTHKKLVPLRVGEHLDTAPLSNVVLWAPDSRHAAILYRIDRRVLEVRLFAVADGKVRSIKVPSLVDTVGKGHFKPGVKHETSGCLYRVTWQQPDRFALEEFDTFDAAKPIFSAGLEAYLEVDRWGPERTFTSFSSKGVCEITEAGGLRLSAIKPLSDWKETIVYSPHLLFDPQLGLHTTETTMSSLEAQKRQR